MFCLSDLLRQHIKYTAWATQRLLAAADELDPAERMQDFGTADKSVYGTLSHMYQSEQHWLHRIQNGIGQPPLSLPKNEEWPAIRDGWPPVHQRWRDWVSTLEDQAAQQHLRYRDFKGNQWEQPLWEVLLHVVNHSTHHRGQVSGFLRALGKTPPPLDYIAYLRQLHPAA